MAKRVGENAVSEKCRRAKTLHSKSNILLVVDRVLKRIDKCVLGVIVAATHPRAIKRHDSDR